MENDMKRFRAQGNGCPAYTKTLLAQALLDEYREIALCNGVGLVYTIDMTKVELRLAEFHAKLAAEDEKAPEKVRYFLDFEDVKDSPIDVFKVTGEDSGRWLQINGGKPLSPESFKSNCGWFRVYGGGRSVLEYAVACTKLIEIQKDQLPYLKKPEGALAEYCEFRTVGDAEMFVPAVLRTAQAPWTHGRPRKSIQGVFSGFLSGKRWCKPRKVEEVKEEVKEEVAKPPIGLMPRKLWLEERHKDIMSAYKRYRNGERKQIPKEWAMEKRAIEAELFWLNK